MIMSFNTALSGLRAATEELSVTGNNIANASTMGFKKSRTEFGDLYASTLIGAGGTQAGSGVLVTDISQQYDQGNISFTDNALDLAISGGGFFVLNDGGSTTYTRSGYFGLDDDGYIVANNDAILQGYPVDDSGSIQSGTPEDLRIRTDTISPALTQQVELELNLDSSSDILTGTDFSATDTDTYNDATSLTIYDSQGNSHVLSQYFVKTGSNTWDMNIKVDGYDVGTPSDGAVGDAAVPLTYQLTFNSDGSLASMAQFDYPSTWTTLADRSATASAVSVFQVDNWEPLDPDGVANGATANTGSGLTDPATSSSFQIDVASATQFSGEFSVTSVDQDGFGQGQLAGVEVDESGVIFARYTNGEALTLGQVVLASFDNEQGLIPLGDTSWAESFESGAPAVGAPQSGSLGAIQAGALEESNVELSEELVQLIIAQRNYQANAKTIETADTVTQTIINLR
jgi:flagellar hook protein FlgE